MNHIFRIEYDQKCRQAAARLVWYFGFMLSCGSVYEMTYYPAVSEPVGWLRIHSKTPRRTVRTKHPIWSKFLMLIGIYNLLISTSVADPVHFFRIRIRVTQKKTGSYLDMFLMFSKIYIFYGIFLLNLNSLWHLKLQLKILFGRNCIYDIFI